jgi:DNA-binding response OmpR family regulator
MTQPQILVVDDNYELVRGLRGTLLDEGYEVYTAVNGLEGLKAARRYHPDLIVLDIAMPIIDGLEVCRQLRQDETMSKIGILFLTSHSSVEERVAGLEGGGDDYLSKPFDLNEFKARVKALLRRSEGTAASRQSFLTLGPLHLDRQTYQVSVNQGPLVQLTPAEYELLHFFMTHENRPFSSDQLLEGAWSYEVGTADPSLARWHVRNLRNKIEPDPAHPVYLRTVPRLGYILAVRDTSPTE